MVNAKQITNQKPNNVFFDKIFRVDLHVRNIKNCTLKAFNFQTNINLNIDCLFRKINHFLPIALVTNHAGMIVLVHSYFNASQTWDQYKTSNVVWTPMIIFSRSILSFLIYFLYTILDMIPFRLGKEEGKKIKVQ